VLSKAEGMGGPATECEEEIEGKDGDAEGVGTATMSPSPFPHPCFSLRACGRAAQSAVVQQQEKDSGILPCH